MTSPIVSIQSYMQRYPVLSKYPGGGAAAGGVAGWVIAGPVGAILGAIGGYVVGSKVASSGIIASGTVDYELPKVTSNSMKGNPTGNFTVQKGKTVRIWDPLGGAVNTLSTSLSSNVVNSGLSQGGYVKTFQPGTYPVNVSWIDQYGNDQSFVLSLQVL